MIVKLQDFDLPSPIALAVSDAIHLRGKPIGVNLRKALKARAHPT